MRKILVFIVLTQTLLSNSQIKLAEMVQKPQLTTANEYQLFYIDMWATWCVPCVTAKKYLGVVQEQYSSDLLIVSITKENRIKINKYLKKNPTKLAIGVDYESELHDRINPLSYPHGVLFNAKGDIIWEGTSTNLKPKLIQEYLRKNKTTVSYQDFFKIMKEEEKKELLDYNPINSLEYKELKSKPKFKRIENDSIVKYTGSLEWIISDIAKMNIKQISVPLDINKYYELYFKKNKPEPKIALIFLKLINVKLKINKEVGEVLYLDNTNATYWDSDQIDLGFNKAAHHTNGTDIEADNLSLKDLSYQLSKLLDKPVIIKNEDQQSLTPKDWQLHYKYKNFMIENFEVNYNIIAKEMNAEYQVFHLSKN